MKDRKKKKNKEKSKEKLITTRPDTKEESKRLQRIIGQVEGISNMLNNGRSLEDILTQCKAVHSALRAVESRLLKHYLDAALASLAQTEKKKSREAQLDELMSLYKPVS